MKIKIKDLTWDKAIYPRTNKSRQTITAYAEALALDPMASGCVVPDVCLLFERKCQAFDLATGDNRPEIEYHHHGLLKCRLAKL